MRTERTGSYIRQRGTGTGIIKGERRSFPAEYTVYGADFRLLVACTSGREGR